MANTDSTRTHLEDADRNGGHNVHNYYCKDHIRGFCPRENCRYVHEKPPKSLLKELFRFCHDFQNKGCFRQNCKFIHSTVEDEEVFYSTGLFPKDPRVTPICQAHIHGTCNNQECNYIHPPKPLNEGTIQPPLPPVVFNRHPPVRDDDTPPETKYRRFTFEENGHGLENCIAAQPLCVNCETLDHKVKLLHDNISVLLKKVADLSEKNLQLTSMNELLLEQTASIRTEQSCVITSRHGASAPVSLATVSVTPVVSLAGALPALVPTAATPNLALAPAASRAQILTPAPQILAVSTTQQLVGNSGTLIVTSAGAQQLMQVSDSGTLMGGGQTVVAVTPAQLTIAPPTQQLMGNGGQATVQQLVQQSAQQLVQPQLASQHQASQYAAAQQSVQHLAAQQNAQHLAAQQSAQHLAAQQNAQHLAAQQNAQHLAAQQSAQHLAAQQTAHLAAQQSAQHLAAQQSAQHLAAQQSAQLAAQQSAQQQLVHQTSTQQITISTSSQPMALPNSQAQPISFPIISQSIMPH